MGIAEGHVHKMSNPFRLRMAIILTSAGMLIEFIGGLLSNSLALISDAGHMLTHLFALGMSYFALMLSWRPADKKRTYGFFRAEVLAAFVNGIALIFISGYLVYEAVLRFISPERIKVAEMLLVGGIGLVINGVSTILLAKDGSGDLNIRSALLHEVGDIISSVVVVAGGIFIFYTQNYLVDPLLSFLICVLIVIWAVRLLMDAGNILLESTPKHLNIDEVILAVKSGIEGIYEMHHVHAWTIASCLYAFTAHVVIDDCQMSKANKILNEINALLKKRFHIGHTNIQFECLIKK